jgi:hypothetical protein
MCPAATIVSKVDGWPAWMTASAWGFAGDRMQVQWLALLLDVGVGAIFVVGIVAGFRYGYPCLWRSVGLRKSWFAALLLFACAVVGWAFWLVQTREAERRATLELNRLYFSVETANVAPVWLQRLTATTNPDWFERVSGIMPEVNMQELEYAEAHPDRIARMVAIARELQFLSSVDVSPRRPRDFQEIARLEHLSELSLFFTIEHAGEDLSREALGSLRDLQELRALYLFQGDPVLNIGGLIQVLPELPALETVSFTRVTLGPPEIILVARARHIRCIRFVECDIPTADAECWKELSFLRGMYFAYSSMDEASAETLRGRLPATYIRVDGSGPVR